MSGMKFRLALATAAAAVLSTAAHAEDAQQRLPELQLLEPSTATNLEHPRDLLTLIEAEHGSGAATSGKQLHYAIDGLAAGATLDVTWISSRHRPSHRGDIDRYKVHQGGARARLPISSNLDLLVTGDLAYRPGHVGTVPASYGESKTYAARAGIGIAGKSWSLTAHVETVFARTSRRPMHRMAELLGGAPAERTGMAVLFHRDFRLSPRNRLSLGLTGRATRRSQRDLELIGISGTRRSEQQAMLRATLSF
ncbi:MAG: hypothetical protein P8J20_12670 [Novosphingobium sp.]|nr:hypothetical protein [Novosphingobium sp.]